MKPFAPPVPVVTRALIILCVLVQLVETALGRDFALWLNTIAGLVPARLSGAGAALASPVPAPLTLLTSMFMLGGWAHLAFNMLFLAWVGRYVEWVVGRWRFLALYMLAGVSGGLLQVVVDPASLAPVIGASGAIAGVFGSYAVLFARSRAAGRVFLGINLSSDAVTALWYASVWVGLQLLTALAFSSGSLQVAIWSHIGGFITGLIFAQPYVRGPRIERRD
ncbi:MAG: rhomboid family intramembrane serine protease [Polymorphobacter sp.]